MEGSHSLFGLIWQVATATGWTVHHILWEIAYPTLILMAADAPHFVTGKTRIRKSRNRKSPALNLFQTKLEEEREE